VVGNGHSILSNLYSIFEQSKVIRRLCVFDFDGTLFRSPHPPDWWEDKDGWWFQIESMIPPCLPKVPSDWWIESTVKAAREEMKDEYSYVVLLTGRPREVFTDRIHALLGQKGLNFDEVHLSDRVDTNEFKVEQIQRILLEHPTIRMVDLWEDWSEMIPSYQAAVEETGVSFTPHEVKVSERKSPCTEDEFIAGKVALRYGHSV